MKKLEIYRRVLFYKVRSYQGGEYDMFTNYETIFYVYKGVEKRKKFWLFGPEYDYEIYEEVFTLGFNIESKNYSKKEVRDKIYEQVKLLERQEEIEKGELI